MHLSSQLRSEFICWLNDLHEDDADNKNESDDVKLYKHYVNVPYNNTNNNGGINDNNTGDGGGLEQCLQTVDIQYRLNKWINNTAYGEASSGSDCHKESK